MSIKRNNGFTAIDMIIAIIAIFIFSGLIISLIHNNAVENIKIERESLAILYLTETFENIGIANYDDIIQENIDSFIPDNLKENGYKIDINIISDFELSNFKDEKIIKKIEATISYDIAGKKYEHYMERIKARE